MFSRNISTPINDPPEMIKLSQAEGGYRFIITRSPADKRSKGKNENNIGLSQTVVPSFMQTCMVSRPKVRLIETPINEAPQIGKLGDYHAQLGDSHVQSVLAIVYELFPSSVKAEKFSSYINELGLLTDTTPGVQQKLMEDDTKQALLGLIGNDSKGLITKKDIDDFYKIISSGGGLIGKTSPKERQDRLYFGQFLKWFKGMLKR